jgi:hypothetical protein
MNFRPSPEDRRTLEAFSRELGITYADVIRLALRQLAKHGVSVRIQPEPDDAGDDPATSQ